MTPWPCAKANLRHELNIAETKIDPAVFRVQAVGKNTPQETSCSSINSLGRNSGRRRRKRGPLLLIYIYYQSQHMTLSLDIYDAMHARPSFAKELPDTPSSSHCQMIHRRRIFRTCQPPDFSRFPLANCQAIRFISSSLKRKCAWDWIAAEDYHLPTV